MRRPSIKTLVHALARLTGAGASSRRFGESGSRLWGTHFAGARVLAGVHDGSIAVWDVPPCAQGDAAEAQRAEGRAQRAAQRLSSPPGSRGRSSQGSRVQTAPGAEEAPPAAAPDAGVEPRAGQGGARVAPRLPEPSEP